MWPCLGGTYKKIYFSDFLPPPRGVTACLPDCLVMVQGNQPCGVDTRKTVLLRGHETSHAGRHRREGVEQAIWRDRIDSTQCGCSAALADSAVLALASLTALTPRLRGLRLINSPHALGSAPNALIRSSWPSF